MEVVLCFLDLIDYEIWDVTMASEGWATVPDGTLIIGFTRFKPSAVLPIQRYDWIDELQKAWYEASIILQGECIEIDWWNIWDHSTANRSCPDGFALNAIYRATGDGSIFLLTRARYHS